MLIFTSNVSDFVAKCWSKGNYEILANRTECGVRQMPRRSANGGQRGNALVMAGWSNGDFLKHPALL